jgi:hypothetical protein
MDFERRQPYLYPGHPVPFCTTLGGSRCVDGFVFARGLGPLSAYTSSYPEMRHDL